MCSDKGLLTTVVAVTEKVTHSLISIERPRQVKGSICGSDEWKVRRRVSEVDGQHQGL